MSPKQVNQHQLFPEEFVGSPPKKVPGEDETVFRRFCLSFAMQTLMPQFTGPHIRYNQGSNTYPPATYEGSHNERSSPLYAEARNPHVYSEDRSPRQQLTHWEVRVPSGSPYQTERRKKMENHVCVLGPGNVPFKFKFSLWWPPQTLVAPVVFLFWFGLVFVCIPPPPTPDCFEMEFVENKDLSFSI